MKKKVLLSIALIAVFGFFLFGCKRNVTITFYPNGGEPVENKTFNQNDEVKDLVVPTKEGNTFDGWFFDEGLTNPFEDGYVITRNIKLYAKWLVNNYKISFVANNGDEIEEISIPFGATITGIPDTLEKEGHSWGGMV